MRKLVGLVAIIVVFFMSGCSFINLYNIIDENDTCELEMTCIEGFMFDEKECDCVEDPNYVEPVVYDELEPGERDDLVNTLKSVDKKTQEFTTFEFVTDISWRIEDLDNSYAVADIASSILQVDIEDFYIHFEAKEKGYDIVEKDFMIEKDGKIIQVINNDGIISEKVLAEDTSSSSIYKVLLDYGLVGGEEPTYDFLGNVKRVSNNKFTAQVAFHRADEYFGRAFMVQFGQITDADINSLRFDLTYTFDPDHTGYTVDIEFEMEGYFKGRNVIYSFTISQSYDMTTFEKVSLVEMGYPQPSFDTMSEVNVDAPFGERARFDTSSDDNNWIRYYLEEGIYYTILDDMAYPAEYRNVKMYNDKQEEIPITYPLVIETEGYYYINLATTEKQLDFHIKDTGLIDVVHLIAEDPVTGTVEIFIEGKSDVNSLTFEAVDYDRYVMFNITKSSSITLGKSYSLDGGENFYGFSQVSPYLFIPANETMYIRYSAKEELSVTIEYIVIDPKKTTQDFTDTDNMEDISYYDLEKPIQLGGEVEFAYFLITIDEPGNHKINTWCKLGNCYNVNYVIYTLDGTELPFDYKSVIFSNPGTYIVKMYQEGDYKDEVFFICNVQ